MTFILNPMEVRTLQKHALYSLQVFHAFCTEHDLKYTLAYGTLIGSLRTGKMIPWDDDIDVVMKRSEYDRFVVLAKDHLNKEVFVQNYHTDPEYIHAFTRLTVEGSLAIQEAWAELDFHKGIFMDVFPLDKIAPEHKREQHMRQVNRYRRMKMGKLYAKNESSVNPFVDSIKRFLLKPFSFQYLNRKLDEAAQTYNNDPSLNLISSMMEGIKAYYMRFAIDQSYFDDIVEVEFEGRLYPRPRRADEILTQYYGNYMEPPSIELQEPHHGFVEFKFRDDIDDLLKNS